MEPLASLTAAATAHLSEATPGQLALAFVAGLCALWIFSHLAPFLLFASALAGLVIYTFWAAPVPATLATWAVVMLYVAYTIYRFKEWERTFAGHRLTQRSKGCPSNQQLPDVKPLEGSKARILENSRPTGISHFILDTTHDDTLGHESFNDSELLHAVADMTINRKENEQFRRQSKRPSTLTPIPMEEAQLLEDKLEDEKEGCLGFTKAKELNMDHIFVKFADFLWAHTFIGPFSYILCLRGTTLLRLRKFLHQIGLINPRCDYEAVAAKLLLEQTQSIHYYGRKGNVAGFFFADMPYVDENCDIQTANLFAVDINLETKRFVRATLDDEILTAKQAVILLWYNTVTAQHAKIHAMANWGVNLDDSLKGHNDFLRRNSVATVMYNRFGFSGFNGFTKEWSKQGLLSEGWAEPKATFVKSLTRGFKNGVWAHPQIKELAKYSRFINFIVKVRAIFMAEFQKHKDLFPGVNGEAMFIGTVLHSLDHTFADWNLEDALYLDISDGRFGKMAEMGRVVKVGFISDIDGLYFHKRFKNSGHPFYDAVYKKAAKIDRELADSMDTCIIK